MSPNAFDGRASEFKVWFRMPLYKIEALVDKFIDRGWVRLSSCYSDHTVFHIRVHLLVVGCLDRLGNGTQFCKLHAVSHISTTKHYHFFHKFLDKMCSIKGEWINLPQNKEELCHVAAVYDAEGLSGCYGSINVVHVKWGNCPAEDYSHSKGKETYPSIAWEVTTDSNHQIMSVFGPQFGTCNDKLIFHMDDGVNKIKNSWYSNVKWKYL